MFVVTSSSPPAKVTTRGEISLQDIAHKITFFQSPPPFYLSERFVVENIRCKHRQIMQYLIFELRSLTAPMESRGRPAEIFIYLKTRIL